MFVDRTVISATAGDGGHGCCSFRREKFVPRGGPDGGDGGKGGDIIFEVDPNVNNLATFRFAPVLRSRHGEHGMGKQCYGKNAKDEIFKVPPGTVIYRLPDDVKVTAGPVDDWDGPPPDLSLSLKSVATLERDTLPVVIDLTEPGMRFILCKGGRGGRGNMKFKSSVNRAPRRTENGFPGEHGRFLLEIKTKADFGLVGYPNAGKSSLLAAISHATPKIAPYPFTTLNPVLGVVELPDYKRFTVADIPGLVEGAHDGAGLGHDFLRHIERCRAFAFVVDMAGSEGRSPIDDFQKVREELKLYRKELADRRFIVVANKMDLPGAEEHLEQFKKRFRRKTLPVSTITGDGIEAVKKALAVLLTP